MVKNDFGCFRVSVFGEYLDMIWNNDDKLKNFIPTKIVVLALMEDILSNQPTSTEKSKVLYWTYGKGKSYCAYYSPCYERDVHCLRRLCQRFKRT